MKLRLGFTLTELMAVIAIVAILMAIRGAFLSLREHIVRISSEVNGLLGDLQLARSEDNQEGCRR